MWPWPPCRHGPVSATRTPSSPRVVVHRGWASPPQTPGGVNPPREGPGLETLHAGSARGRWPGARAVGLRVGPIRRLQRVQHRCQLRAVVRGQAAPAQHPGAALAAGAHPVPDNQRVQEIRRLRRPLVGTAHQLHIRPVPSRHDPALERRWRRRGRGARPGPVLAPPVRVGSRLRVGPGPRRLAGPAAGLWLRVGIGKPPPAPPGAGGGEEPIELPERPLHRRRQHHPIRNASAAHAAWGTRTPSGATAASRTGASKGYGTTKRCPQRPPQRGRSSRARRRPQGPGSAATPGPTGPAPSPFASGCTPAAPPPTGKRWPATRPP